MPLSAASPRIETFIANERAILRPGDIVLAAVRDGVEVTISTVGDFNRVLAASGKPSIVTIYFRHEDKILTRTLLVPAASAPSPSSLHQAMSSSTGVLALLMVTTN
jgi:hypothetical protein